MGDVTADVPPQHRPRLEPRGICRQGPPPQPPCRGADDGLDGLIGRGSRVLPRPRARARGMPVAQGLHPCGARRGPVAASAHPHGFARMRGDRAQPIPLVRRPWGGSMTGWPRGLHTARRTVSSEPRILVGAARSSPRRGRVQRAPGRPTRRGRWRPAASHATRSASLPSEGRPGRGASCTPARPAARSRLRPRNTVAARTDDGGNRGDLAPVCRRQHTHWARGRRRGTVVGRESRSSGARGVGVIGGMWTGLIAPVSHHAAKLSWLYLVVHPLNSCYNLGPLRQEVPHGVTLSCNE
jgi:hypothetical protein